MARKRVGKGRARRMRRHPISKGLGGVPDVASLTENITVNTSGRPTYNVNQGYGLYNVSLATTSRARIVAEAYQEFRIRRITLVYKGAIDTYTNQIGVTPVNMLSVPYLYYLVDKKMTLSNTFDYLELQASGCIPRRMDDKNIKVKYAPAVLQSALTDPTALSTAVASAQISPWLPCNVKPQDGTGNPSDVDHTGIAWWVRQAGVTTAGGSGNGGVAYDVEILVDFEFRKPRLQVVAPAVGTPFMTPALNPTAPQKLVEAEATG